MDWKEIQRIIVEKDGCRLATYWIFKQCAQSGTDSLPNLNVPRRYLAKPDFYIPNIPDFYIPIKPLTQDLPG